MKLTGKQFSADSSQVSDYNVTDARISDDGKEIFIDYFDQRKDAYIKLKSKDGINFYGEYGSADKKGDCEFILYKNGEEFLLLGGYSGVEDGQGSWWIKLKPASLKSEVV